MCNKNVSNNDDVDCYLMVKFFCSYRYPVGHPTVITEGFSDVSNYFGFIKCCILPPRGLFHPVLPYRCRGKLMFPLCKTCAETSCQDKCSHTDEKRCIIGTWVTEEVKKAIKKGYRIIKVPNYL